MKKIGVIGGMGPEATIQLYKEIVGILQTDFGAKYDSDYPEMYIINLPIPDIVERPDNFAKVEQMMIDACRKLYSLGADYIVIPCNTINIIYEGYNGSVPISILNIIEETAINLKGDGIKKIGLLSTKTTYDSGIYEKYLGKYGIEILKPSQKEIQEVNEIIIRILSGGKSVRDKSFLIEVAQDLVRKGAEGVVLGCTDLSLIIGQEDVSFPIFDTIKILADSAVARLINTMKNKIISRKIIKEEFSFLSRAEYCGVKGVIRIDSGRPGPTLGLTICTHGNEVAGLSAVNYLRGKYNIAKKLIRGSLVITLNNLKATGRALEAKDEMSRLKSRYIDLNFNRLPKNLRKIRRDNRYEINRAKDLLPIWAMFDVALDIHSTIQDNPPMIVASDNLDYRLIRGFPIKTVISNIVKVQIGAPAFSFYGSGRHIQTVEIESGQHDRASSQAVAVKCILSLLKSLGMIRGGNRAEEKVFDEYFIDGSIIFPDRQASLARAFKDFEFIRKGESLATVHGRVIKARKDCCIIMAPKGLKPARVGEEAVFLSRPVNKKII